MKARKRMTEKEYNDIINAAPRQPAMDYGDCYSRVQLLSTLPAYPIFFVIVKAMFLILNVLNLSDNIGK